MFYFYAFLFKKLFIIAFFMHIQIIKDHNISSFGGWKQYFFHKFAKYFFVYGSWKYQAVIFSIIF